MAIKALIVDPVSNMPVIVLQREGSSAYLPIWIGLSEANAIALRLEGVTTPRPMTHDLLLSLIQNLRSNLDSILINALEDNVFFAVLRLRDHGGALVEVDARPSDAVALALRAGVPIYAAPTVLERAETHAVDEENTLRQILERLRPEDLGQYEM